MTERAVLGLVDGISDAGAALFVGDRLVAAVNEERLTRTKLQGGFPERSIDTVLTLGGIRPSDVDLVAVGGIATPSVVTRLSRRLQARLGGTAGIVFEHADSPLERLADLARYRLRLTTNRPGGPGGRIEAALAGPLLRRRLPAGARRARLLLVDHHTAHAASAYFGSGFDRALVVTADSLGDGCSLTVSYAEGTRVRRVFSADPFVSFGTFYALVTRHLGFRPYRHEGKVLALAAAGDARRVGVPFPLRYEDGALRYDGAWGLRAWPWLARLSAYAREDVAAWLQQGLETGLLAIVGEHQRRTGVGDLCVAGGVFANVRLNARLAGAEGTRRLHVFPHMGDGGLAVGAVLAALRPAGWTLPSLALGPGFDDAALRRALGPVPHHRPADLAEEVARLLASGRVVAHFDGRMEYGPRALGHRSVLAEAKRSDVREDLNRRLNRTEFMPFAPVLLDEGAAERVAGLERAPQAGRHMTVAFAARPKLVEEAPGAVHVDRTARCQVATRSEHPRLWAVLDRYRRATGRSTLINTSFNRHEEPIVCTPDDAVKTFCEGGLDALALGPYLALAPGVARPGAARAGLARVS